MAKQKYDLEERMPGYSVRIIKDDMLKRTRNSRWTFDVRCWTFVFSSDVRRSICSLFRPDGVSYEQVAELIIGY